MKVLGIMCSPRLEGNTHILLQEALAAASGEGAETELITVADKDIKPCDGCCACDTTGQCKITDDMQAVYDKMRQADGIIFGTPVHYANVSTHAKMIIDRTYALRKDRVLRGKVAAAVIAARRIGAGSVLSILYTFFVAQRMLIVGGAIGYGIKKGEVRQGIGGSSPSAMDEAKAVGRGIVRLINQTRKSPG